MNKLIYITIEVHLILVILNIIEIEHSSNNNSFVQMFIEESFNYIRVLILKFYSTYVGKYTLIKNS